jgi:hypothetical protein
MRKVRPNLLAAVVRSSLAAVVVAAAALSLAPAARADGGFRCGSRLVRNGETQDDVAAKCGDPDATREWTEVETHSVWEGGQKIERSVQIAYSEWKYDFGKDRLIRYLTFVQGRLRDVRTGEYGQKR